MSILLPCVLGEYSRLCDPDTDIETRQLNVIVHDDAEHNTVFDPTMNLFLFLRVPYRKRGFDGHGSASSRSVREIDRRCPSALSFGIRGTLAYVTPIL